MDGLQRRIERVTAGQFSFSWATVNAAVTTRRKVLCRYNWHSAGSLGWPVPMLKYYYIFSNKIYGRNFIKEQSETVMV